MLKGELPRSLHARQLVPTVREGAESLVAQAAEQHRKSFPGTLYACLLRPRSGRHRLGTRRLGRHTVVCATSQPHLVRVQ